MGGGHIVFHHIVSHGCANSFMFIAFGGEAAGPEQRAIASLPVITHNYSCSWARPSARASACSARAER
jgi:hypothetical protein